jgi:hypothetical protein
MTASLVSTSIKAIKSSNIIQAVFFFSPSQYGFATSMNCRHAASDKAAVRCPSSEGVGDSVLALSSTLGVFMFDHLGHRERSQAKGPIAGLAYGSSDSRPEHISAYRSVLCRSGHSAGCAFAGTEGMLYFVVVVVAVAAAGALVLDAAFAAACFFFAE